MDRTWPLSRERVLRAMRWTHVLVGVLTLLAAAGAVLAFGLESVPLALAALVLAVAAVWAGVAASRLGRELKRAGFFTPEGRLGERTAGVETWLPVVTGAAGPGTGLVVLYLIVRRVNIRLSHGTGGRKINWIFQFGTVEPEPEAAQGSAPVAEESPVDGGPA